MNLTKIGLILSLVVAVTLPSEANAEQQTKFGNWLFRVSKDAMTDEIIKAAVVPNFDDDLNTRLLIVECAGGKELTVFLQTERFINLQSKPSQISYRFGEKPPLQQTWNVTPNEATALIDTAPENEIIALVKSLSSETGKFRLRYSDSNGSDYDVSFPLNGSTAALKGVIQYCQSHFQ